MFYDTREAHTTVLGCCRRRPQQCSRVLIYGRNNATPCGFYDEKINLKNWQSDGAPVAVKYEMSFRHVNIYLLTTPALCPRAPESNGPRLTQGCRKTVLKKAEEKPYTSRTGSVKRIQERHSFIARKTDLSHFRINSLSHARNVYLYGFACICIFVYTHY